MVKLTESKFYRVSGASTQHRGVIPDVTLPALFDQADVGESTRETALPWDEINPVPHRKYNYSTSTAADTLQQLHQARLQQDPDLLHLTAELALAKAQRDKKILSLNLEERQRQKEDYEQALLNLENKRRISRNLAPLDDFAALNEDPEAEAVSALASNATRSDPSPARVRVASGRVARTMANASRASEML